MYYIDFSVLQQGISSNAIFMSNYALKDKQEYNGSRPLILLGPNTPAEASSVLNVIRFYSKLMVRNKITKKTRRTSHHGGRGMGWTIGINRGSLESSDYR